MLQRQQSLDNTSGYLVPLKMQFLMTHHLATIQKIIRNLECSTVESINATEELLEIKVKSLECEDIFTEIDRVLAREIDDIVMKPIQRLEFTSNLVEELFDQELKEKSIDLMRDETNIFIVGKVVKLGDKWKIEAVRCFEIVETLSRTFTDVVVRLQDDSHCVYLKGRDVTISKAEKEIQKLFSDLFNEKLRVDPLILKLLICKEASEHFKEVLQKDNLQVVWTVDQDHLYFVSKTKIDTDALKAVVYKTFLTTGFCKSSQYKNQFCDSNVFTKITKQHNDKLLFLETTKTSVNIAGTKSLIFLLLHQENVFYNNVGNTKEIQVDTLSYEVTGIKNEKIKVDLQQRDLEVKLNIETQKNKKANDQYLSLVRKCREEEEKFKRIIHEKELLLNESKDEKANFTKQLVENKTGALKVCKREHKVEGQILKVHVYYECLGQASIDDDGLKFKSLKPTVIQNINPRTIDFLLNSDSNKVAFEKQLSRHYAVVEWPDIKEINDKLDVNCSLTEDVKDCRKLAKTWAKTVKTEAEKFFSMLTWKEIQTLQESWDDVMKHLRELSISNPESVVVTVVKEDCKIVIVGHKMPVDELAEKVEIIMKDVAAEHDRRKLQVTEEVSLKHFQLLVLLYLHFLDKMKKEFEGLIVQVNMKKHTMIFTGIPSHVNAAKVKMFEQIQEITFVTAGKFSVGYIEFLKIPEVKSYVGQQIKQKGVLGVWNVEEGNVITMYSLSDEGAVTACDVLKKSIIEAPINLDDKQSALIGSDVWNDEIKTVEMEYQKALVKIVVADSKTVVIYQTSAEDSAIFLFRNAISQHYRLVMAEVDKFRRSEQKDR
ncbi:unnamed protein product [Mytilus edulis]|uniref:PARP14 first type I KH domain-containing protein n=1 Tax=Mytilus edulis TaxID=6550 RepID=A0A8S3URT9_MYTED|nr:unnamed protein product [Mytilus edulis]